MKRLDVARISDRVLLLNLYLTQALVLAVACVLLWWQGFPGGDLWRSDTWTVWLWGIAAGLTVVSIDLTLTYFFPKHMIDDSGINEKLFQGRPYWHIFVIAAVVAFCEELLFRGALQPLIGIWGTSLVFTLIHFRYLKRWAMTGYLFFVSMVLGWLAQWTGSLVASMAAHFTIDFVLALILKAGWLDPLVRRVEQREKNSSV